MSEDSTQAAAREPIWSDWKVDNFFGMSNLLLKYAIKMRDEYEAERQRLTQANAELAAEVERLKAEALDSPDGPGWWAFEGHWTTAFPERAVIFHHVYDVYLMTDGQWYFQMDNDGHPVGKLTGKWWRVSLPWDAPA